MVRSFWIETVMYIANNNDEMKTGKLIQNSSTKKFIGPVLQCLHSQNDVNTYL